MTSHCCEAAVEFPLGLWRTLAALTASSAERLTVFINSDLPPDSKMIPPTIAIAFILAISIGLYFPKIIFLKFSAVAGKASSLAMEQYRRYSFERATA